MTSLNMEAELMELKRRMDELESEVEGEKLLSRHIFENTRRIEKKVDRLEAKVGRLENGFEQLEGRFEHLETTFTTLRQDFPAIVADTLRDVLKDRL